MNSDDLDTIARAVCDAKKYKFLGFVGAGAFKRTYHVELPSSAIALKIYQPGVSKERTEREIEAMQRCSHRGVCRLEDIFEFENESVKYTVTMEEFLPDGTLAARLPLEISEVRSLGGYLIDALAHIASLGLVHRDIKPDNILFRGEFPVLVDFGLVRDLSASSLTATWAPSGPGTPFFASPEQLRNEKSLIDWRSDEFSLGVTLAISAFGVHPFAQNANVVETVEQVVSRIGPNAQFVDTANEVGLSALVKMVAPWPIGRYRRPQDLVSAWETQT